MQFTFDGCGINDATDPYKRRVATLTDYSTPEAQEAGKIMAAGPVLLEALRNLVISALDSRNGYADRDLHEAWAVTESRALDALKAAGFPIEELTRPEARAGEGTPCDECGELIPDDHPSVINQHHAESCSAYEAENKGEAIAKAIQSWRESR